MKLSEPATAITDYILSIELLFFGVVCLLQSHGQNSNRLWGIAFIALSVAAVAGGTFHGFRHSLTRAQLSRLWKISSIGIALAPLFMTAGGAFASSRGPFRLVLLASVFVVAVVLIVRLSAHEETDIAVRGALPVLILLLVAMLFLLAYRMYRGGSVWIVAGAVGALIAGIAQQKRIGLHRSFNHNDVAHVILMVAMYFLFRGALLLQDQ